MKHKKLFLFLSLACCFEITQAHDFVVNGIYYNKLIDNTVEVTHKGSSGGYSDEYSGDIVIPETVTFNGTTYNVIGIGDQAFYSSSLVSISIPSSISSIGDKAFWYCKALISITIPNTVTSDIGDEMFAYCESLTTAIIGNGVTRIGAKAFKDCWRLTSITIPNSVTSIGSKAFEGCTYLTSITIPESVTSIADDLFSGSQYLASIKFLGTVPPIIVSENSPEPSNLICYVPCGSLEKYIVAYGKYVKHFIENSAHTITLLSSNDTYGVAKVSSRPDCDNAIITAIPYNGCRFIKWSDGNTQATRYLEVTEDITLTAYFAKEGYTIHVYQNCNTTIE